MLAAIGHRGPDGSRLVGRPASVLGHQHFWTTPEEVGERQPLSNAGIDLVFDGRLDNRDVLFADLGEGDRSLSDAALALRAYARWSDKCFERLLGSFAVVVFDAPRRRVVAARDPMGTHTLYYKVTSRLVLLASEEAALLAHPTVSSRLNERVLAEFFAVDAAVDGATFFCEISELLPAQVLVVSEDALHTRRFWNPDPSHRIQRRSDDDYAEEFRSLLKESVRCRMRSVGPPGVMMSGGMDSPPIAALAAAELGQSGGGRLLTFSWVFDELVECDERRWISPVVNRFSLDAVYVSGDGAWPLRESEGSFVDPSRPWANAYRLLKRRVYEAASRRGCRTLLNGTFSDGYYLGWEDWLTDLVRDGRVWEGAAAALRIARRGRTAFGDPGLRRLVRRTLLGTRPDFERDPGQMPWLTPYARRLLKQRPAADPKAAFSRRPDQYDALFGSALALEAPEAFHSSACGIEVRDPYLDLRLVEFALAIPAHQLFGQGQTKRVLRSAMRGLLPPEVVKRTETTDLTALYHRGLLERELSTMQTLLSRKDGLWRRYVSADWLSDVFPRRMREVPDGAASLVPWQCASSQLWIDHVEQSAGHVDLGRSEQTKYLVA